MILGIDAATPYNDMIFLFRQAAVWITYLHLQQLGPRFYSQPVFSKLDLQNVKDYYTRFVHENW